VAMRILWDSPSSGLPSLRAKLRDFFAGGVLACGCGTNAASSIDICHFALLESGPAGKPSQLNADDLAPGFFLAFDFVASSEHDTPSERSVSNVNGGVKGVAKPPSSVREQPPSGDLSKAATPGSSRPLTEDLTAPVEAPASLSIASHLTVLIVATADGAQEREAPYWDVYCSGPHAQWAWRALLGNGTSGPSFTSLDRLKQSQAKRNSAWPLPPPPFVLSSKAMSLAPGSMQSLTSHELLGLSWIFNGPQGDKVRPVLLPQQEPVKTNAITAFCAALCGKTKTLEASGHGDVEGSGLAICGDFEASLCTRDWRMIASLLDEALASGVEAWTLCCAALTRLAHDTAAASAGTCGRTLPLLFSDMRTMPLRNVELIPDGPLPIMNGTDAPALQKPLGTLKASPGVDAWLRVCRPAA